MPPENVDSSLGAHGARLDHLERRLDRQDQMLMELLALANKAKGGWAVMVGVAGIAGTVGGFVGRLIGK